MNVYTLTTPFTSESMRSPGTVQRQYENAFRRALKGSALVQEFSRVSSPDAHTGQMAVVCSEAAATFLRARRDLGITALVLDAGRTERRQLAYGSTL